MEVNMKFKPGNLLKHKKNGGLWIVIETRQINKKGPRRRPTVFRMQLDAVCIQPGLSKCNHAGLADTWYCKEEDGSDHDDNWTVINEV
jgi:hypothetical protein